MTAPDTIVLIHGFWVTPRSWEGWKAYYEAKGYTVHTPAYPGFEVEVEALRADPTPIADLTVEASSTTWTSSSARWTPPPILMGHSAGGAFLQLMLDRGLRQRGVALNSAPTEGVRSRPWTQLQVGVPRPEEPREPPPRGRPLARAVDVRVHQHVHRGGVAGVLRPVPHPGVGPGAIRLGARQLQARPPGRRGSTSTTRTGRRCCSCRAPRTTSCRRRCRRRTRSTTGRGHGHRARDLRRPSAPAWSPVRAGRRSPTARSSGRSRTPPDTPRRA